jgi:hypothetical protein
MDPKGNVMPPAAYANLLRVAFNPGEFYLAFAQMTQASSDGAHLVSSLVTSPVRAKAILRVLSESVQGYEERFGEIPEPEPAEEPKASPVRAKRAAAG